MKKQFDLNGVRQDELINRFIAAAKQMGEAVLDSEVRKANRIYRYMRAIDLELRSRGTSARLQLEPLLEHEDRFVRYYAAKKLLALIPGRARAILEWNHKYGFDALAGDAGMTLHHLDTGFYKPD
jgi:hypothetical protein